MENFNELFALAETTADHRSKVFNQLIEKMTTEILPRFCEVLEKFDFTKSYFKLSNCPNDYCDKQSDERNYFYSICFFANGTYSDCQYDVYEGRYNVPSGWKSFPFNSTEHSFTRSGIVELTKAVNSRLADIIKKQQSKIEEAEKML